MFSSGFHKNNKKLCENVWKKEAFHPSPKLKKGKYEKDGRMVMVKIAAIQSALTFNVTACREKDVKQNIA